MIRTAIVVPLVVASAAWTAHLAAPTTPAYIPTVEVAAVPSLPDGTLVPDGVVTLPATVSPPAQIRSASNGRFATVAARPAAGDIPAVALAAYQRSESLIRSADKSCRLPWQLIAAVGRVESDHGRYDGAQVDENGVSRPAIVGPVLDGSDGTSKVRDTDAGQLDGDTDFDHAVGPLQFIPSTWAVVGVDGDADGQRNPQDVDDAALAAAVYLCSGDDDLSTTGGQRAAIFRYNHSVAYVDQVIAIMRNYLQGNDVLPMQSVINAGLLVPLVPLAEQQDGAKGSAAGSGSDTPTATMVASGPQPEDAGEPAQFQTDMQVDEPAMVPDADPADPTDPTTDPTADPTVPPVEVPTDEPTGTPTDAPGDEPSDVPTDTPGDTPGETPVHDGSAAALEYCTREGYIDNPQLDDDGFDACVTEYDTPADGPGDEPTPAPASTRPEEPAALPVD